MPNLPKARLIGTGSYLPERIMTNQDMEKIVDTSDDWIVSRTGIKERRVASSEETQKYMGLQAAKKALIDAHIEVQDLDMILVASMSPDYIIPSTSAMIQSDLGATKAAALDIQAACTGFIYGLSLAKAFIESGLYDNILVIASEKLTPFLNYKDRNTCVLFGDGAGAAIVSSKGDGFSIDALCLGADGELADKLIIPGGGTRHPATLETIANDLHYVHMDGKEIFKHAVRRMSAAAKECLIKANVAEEQISWLVPHQANIRIIEAIAKNFNIPNEKVFKTLHKYGNTSAASVAIALDELVHGEQISSGTKLLLVAFGAGLTWGAAILTKIEANSFSET